MKYYLDEQKSQRNAKAFLVNNYFLVVRDDWLMATPAKNGDEAHE